LLTVAFDTTAHSSTSVIFIYIPLDYSKGFGGKYGVQKDRVDKVRVWI